MKLIAKLLIFIGLLLSASPSFAAAATLYMDTGGCQSGSTTRCSGSTDSASATVSGAAATITCSATAGPAAAPGCSLTGSPSLAGIAVDGSQTIYVNCATNTNQKIFKINAIDDTLDLVGTTVTPTGCTAASSDWGIGGRMIYDRTKFEAALQGGDTVIINNSPAAQTTSFISATSGTSGSSTAGFITFMGKAGTRPVLQVTNTSIVLEMQNSTNYWRFSNLELQQNGGSGNVFVLGNNSNTQNLAYDIKITDGGGNGIFAGASVSRMFVTNSEITGVGGDGINMNGGIVTINNNIHDNTGDGIESVSTGVGTLFAINNILDTNGGRGFYQSASSSAGIIYFSSNTVALDGNSGFETADADVSYYGINNIYNSNGDAAGEYNVELAAAAELIGWHGYSDYYQGGGSAGNLLNLTTNSTEITTDPQFTNASGANFSLGASSPAKGTGFPGTMLGGTNVGYMSMGALQVQATASGTHGLIIGN